MQTEILIFFIWRIKENNVDLYLEIKMLESIILVTTNGR